jgi:hypothetical protein
MTQRRLGMKNVLIVYFTIVISLMAITCSSKEERAEDCIASEDREQCFKKIFSGNPNNLQQQYYFNDEQNINELCSELYKTKDEILKLNLLQVVFANDPSCACKYLNDIKKIDKKIYDENRVSYEGYCNDYYIEFFYRNRKLKSGNQE